MSRARVILCVIAVVAGVLATAPAASAATVREHPIRTLAKERLGVAESLVRVHNPLPPGTPAHPKACEWLEALRFRHRRGPRRAKNADAVAVLIPGFLGGAGSFDQLARLTVWKAARRGRYIEVWAVDRRANCLEDDRGVNAAARANDASAAYDYYWNGRPVGGKRFGGFVPPEDAEFLREFGLERTVRDWYAVMRTAIPSRRTRARKMLCGGHSLGGPLTAAYASWDFDGNPRTLADAGWAQCAGLVGLDTDVSIEGGGDSPAGSGDLSRYATGAAPYVNVPPLTPEALQLPAVFGVGASVRPRGTDLLRKLPRTRNIEIGQRALFSRDAAHFVTQRPSIREFTISNQAVLAGLFDDNSSQLSFTRASVGFMTGGPIAQKNFPTPDPTLGLPEDPDAPLYGWVNYDRVGLAAPIALNDEGDPFTNRESEVSDIHDLARTMWETPTNFIEQYFPTRIVTDVAAAESGDRSGSLSGLQHDGPAKRPVAEIDAGDSGSNDEADDAGPPVRGDKPNERPHSRRLALPGYAHLDVLTAARRQNDGRPEPASTALTDYTLAVVPSRPRMRVAARPRRVRARKRVRRIRVRVRSAVRRCRRGVRVRIGRRAKRTGRRGRATLRVRLRRRGTVRVRATKRGCRRASARIRVLRRR